MHDLVIIGAGPAGMTASIYASCFKLNHLVIGKLPGGQMTYAPDILNYPGFEEISGLELTDKMVSQLKKRGGQLIIDSVIQITKRENGFEVTTETQEKVQTKTIILATGVERKKLNVPGEIEYTAKGVQYCATCERFDYQNRVTAVIGGANSAAQTAIQLSHAASKTYIVYRGTELRCDPMWLEKIKETQNIEAVYNSTVAEILGDGQKVTALKLQSTNNPSQIKELPVERVFIEIGGVPGSALLIPIGVTMDKGGYMEVNETLSANVPGIFAAGDVVSRKFSIEQISSAVGSGARAAVSVFSFLKQQKAPSLWGEKQIQKPESI